MNMRQIFRFVAVVLVSTLPVLDTAIGIPSPSAASCPDIELTFARGTGESPGLGVIGQELLTSLKPLVGSRSLGSYAVDYPASWNIPASAAAGAQDAAAHVESMATDCPNTQQVLGGISQGAGVIDLITVPESTDSRFQPLPMPASVVPHVAAIAVFGNPARNFPRGGPLTTISPAYGSKAIDFCATGDPFCSHGASPAAHLSYAWNGDIGRAATFIADKLGTASAGVNS
jgi:cutinase